MKEEDINKIITPIWCIVFALSLIAGILMGS